MIWTFLYLVVSMDWTSRLSKSFDIALIVILSTALSSFPAALATTSTHHKDDIVSLQLDLLEPYSNAKAYIDPGRTHRYVRECQEIAQGGGTFEEFKSPPPDPSITDEVQVHYFTKSISSTEGGRPSKRLVSGHISFKNKPLKSFSVLEPNSAGSCNHKNDTTSNDPRTKSSISSLQRKCIVAANGGFFNTRSGACIGNIVSDGRRVQDSKGVQNANLGIRADGTIVVGYLDQQTVLAKANPFVQLITGVGWLLRNGEVYTTQSLKAECADSQETGNLKRFFSVHSARTAVGHDAKGRLIIAHVDGKTDQYGVSLEDFATLLKEFGVLNAINLDGGGSSTYVLNGTVVNYPSDNCPNRLYKCERKVTTIVCLHNGETNQQSSTMSNETSASNTSKRKSPTSILCSFSLIIAISSVLGLSILLNICLIAQRAYKRQPSWYYENRAKDIFGNDELQPLAMDDL